jgi:hypothetical protein
LRNVNVYGGVLEHPQSTMAWKRFGLNQPIKGKWIRTGRVGWTCCVWQSAYGHRANKATWLYYSGKRPPFELNWSRPKGTHQVEWTDHGRADPRTNKPTLSKKESNATPPAFRDVLIELARWSRGPA